MPFICVFATLCVYSTICNDVLSEHKAQCNFRVSNSPSEQIKTVVESIADSQCTVQYVCTLTVLIMDGRLRACRLVLHKINPVAVAGRCGYAAYLRLEVAEPHHLFLFFVLCPCSDVP